MGLKKLPYDQYVALKQKIAEGQKLTKEELHAFSEDYLYREKAKKEVRRNYISESGSFARISFSFFDENELEEFNPDPESRKAAAERNREAANRINTMEKRAAVLMEYYRDMLNTNIEDLCFKSDEEAMKYTLEHPDFCLLGFDPSPITTTTNGETEPTEEMRGLFDEFSAVLQNQGDGWGFFRGAGQDMFMEIPELKSKKEADAVKELFEIVAASPEKNWIGQVPYVAKVVAVKGNTTQIKAFSQYLNERGFTGNTLGDLLTMNYTDEVGKKLSINEAIERVTDGKTVNMTPKTPAELQKMQEIFDNPFKNPALNKKGVIAVPEQPKLGKAMAKTRAAELEIKPPVPARRPAPRNAVQPRPARIPNGRQNLSKEARWLEELNQALKAGGAELDLNEPADLARLAIIKPTKDRNGDPSIDFSFALDRDRYFRLYNGIDDEFEYDKDNLLARQPDRISVKDIKKLIKAAKNNELYLLPLNSSRNKADIRQINMNDGHPSLSDDFRTAQEKHDEALSFLADTEILIKPNRPSLGTRILSFFGNQKARTAMQNYNSDLAAYNTQLAERNAVMSGNEWVYKMNQVCGMLTAPGNIGYAKLNISLDTLHKEAQFKDLPREEKTYMLDRTDKLERLATLSRQLSEYRIELEKKPDIAQRRILVNAMVLYADIMKADQLKRTGRLAEFRPDVHYDAEANRLLRDETFNKVMDSMKGINIVSFADEHANPDTVLNAMRTVNKRYFDAKNKLEHPAGIIHSNKLVEEKTDDTRAMEKTDSFFI